VVENDLHRRRLPDEAAVLGIEDGRASAVAEHVEAARGDDPGWAAWLSVALAAFAVGLARVRTVPNAVRLGGRRDPADTQSALARSVLGDHVACFAAILGLLVLQLAAF
jgi:hypothetical protein